MAENTEKWCQQPGACRRSGKRFICRPCHTRRRLIESTKWPVWRHVKRGMYYIEIARGKMQEHVTGELDMCAVVIYRSVDNREFWVRPVAEFEDGRFERVSK